MLIFQTRMQSLSPVSAGQTIISTYRNMVMKEGYLRWVIGFLFDESISLIYFGNNFLV